MWIKTYSNVNKLDFISQFKWKKGMIAHCITYISLWFLKEVSHCWWHVYGLCTESGCERADGKYSVSHSFSAKPPSGAVAAVIDTTGNDFRHRLVQRLKSSTAQLFDRLSPCQAVAANHVFSWSTQFDMSCVNYERPPAAQSFPACVTAPDWVWMTRS